MSGRVLVMLDMWTPTLFVGLPSPLQEPELHAFLAPYCLRWDDSVTTARKGLRYIVSD